MTTCSDAKAMPFSTRRSALDNLATRARDSAADPRGQAIWLHDQVRDHVAFGFTPRFDAAGPEQTWALAVGHCNPQARLMVDLFRRIGLEARFAPVTITNAVLRGVAQTPPRLSHVFTEVSLGGRWIRLDSYIVDPPLRRAAVARLHAEGRTLGYGCHVTATGEWNGEDDAFSQIATSDLVVEEHPPVDDIEDFYRSPAYRHRVGWLRYADLLRPLWPLSSSVARGWNAGVERVR
jgi:transglutaminase-like putative cysteine protease